MHPLGPDGKRLDGKSESSNGSWMYCEDKTLADLQKSKAEDERKVRWEPPTLSRSDEKPRWGPPTSVHRNCNYPSSVLDKDGYL